jgi:pimeloyl-ACP methyl ester carboxylesterase
MYTYIIIFIFIFIFLHKRIIIFIKNSILFIPPPPISILPSNAITIKSKNGNNIIYYLIGKKSDTVFIFSNGNGCSGYNISFQMEKWVKDLHCTGLTYDYQGYGFSEGKPNEKNCCEDLKSIINNVQDTFKNIYLIGHSLGTGVVIDYISKNDWSTPVMLISPYKSILRVMTDQVSEHIGKYLYYYDSFMSIDKIKYITCAVKIVHGEKDNIIDISHGKYLYDILVNKSCKPEWLSDCGHNNILDNIDCRIFKDLMDGR